jgi:asparagine synthase (glutamine-hydrolysing)
MCGIAGIIKWGKAPVHQAEVDVVLDTIAHRGPDSRGTYIRENVGLGHVRLSIIDLSAAANQPLNSPDDLLTIVFNGEIYNYRALREELAADYDFRTESDTEVILAAYRIWGDDCLSRLNGMFSFVIYDRQRKRLFAARDRFGVKPFYYTQGNNCFVFASEIKGILASGVVQATINDEVLYDFIVFNRTDHTAQTCFQNVLNLRPGHQVVIDLTTDKVDICPWYILPPAEDADIHFETARKMLRERLEQSIALHLVSDVPVGSALSGGLDSSSIVSLMRDAMPTGSPIHVFSAVYDDRWDRNEKSYVEACINEKHLTPHFVHPDADALLNDLDALILQQEEPFANASIFAHWCVQREAGRSGIKVLLNGQGSDEIFGYDYMAAFHYRDLFRKFKLISLIREWVLFCRKQADVSFTVQLFLFLMAPAFLARFLVRIANPLVNANYFRRYANNNLFFRDFFSSHTLNQNVRNHLQMKLHHLLRVEDKNAMKFGVEGRVPFLEPGVVELALKIPGRYKVFSGEVKYILRQAMRDILPELIYKRNNKIGFETPMDQWFREPRFAEFINDMLGSMNQPMASRLNIPILRAKWEAHLAKRENNGAAIWKYLYLTRWHQLYFHSEAGKKYPAEQ